MQFIFNYSRVLLVLFFIAGNSFSQIEKKFIHDGNTIYHQGKYEEAEKSYQKALEKNPTSPTGKFNMADALYRQKKYDEAAKQFGNIAGSSEDKNLKAKAFHNLGNSMLQSQKLKECVDAYKNALRNNPNDEDTRKNLAYAMRMMQQEQNQQKQNDKNDQKDNKDQKDQKQNQENQEKKDQKENQEKKEQQENEKQENQEQGKEQKKDQLSKQDAQRLLESMNNDEKKLQEKLKREKLQKVQPVEIEKDW